MSTALGPVLLSDPVVLDLPLLEDGTPLVDLRAVGIEVVAAAPALPPAIRPPRPYAAGLGHAPVGTPRAGLGHAWVRETVAERLVAADESLPSGIRLLVVEGLRPMAVQRTIHDAYRAVLAAQRPAAAEPEIDLLTSRFVAPPEIAPHVSGAAVDLTLTGPEGPLDLGTPIDATPEESGGACYFDAGQISVEARRHRTLLAAALTGSGLVNYPTEWWHWSFGDRYWALTTGRPFAIHGPI